MGTGPPMPPPGFDDLTPEEKLEYLEALSEYVSAGLEDLPVPEGQRKLVRDRLAAHKRGEGATVPWSTVDREADEFLRELPEEPTQSSDEGKRPDAIYAILEARFDTGEAEAAAEHDRHQP